jgi:lysophospholipase L1-like esterase
MNRHRLLFVYFALFSLFCPILSARAEAPAPSGLLIKDGEKIAFLGDSLTALGWDVTGGWIHLVTSGLDTLGVKITAIHAGVGGHTAQNLLDRLDKDALSSKPDWLLLNCGVNDIFSHNVSLDQFKTNVTAIVDKAQAAGVKVMLLTTTPIYEKPDMTAGFVAVMKDIAREKHLPVADLNAAWLDFIKARGSDFGGPVLSIDGIHQNTDAHLTMARCILKTMGVTSGQMEKVEAAWLAAPDFASIWLRVYMGAEDRLTPTQYAALQKVAADRKQTLSELANGIQLESLKEALEAIQSRGDFSKIHDSTIRDEVKPIFQKKIEELGSNS